MGITWEECAQLPTGQDGGKTTVINAKVYFGGGFRGHNDDLIVLCYDPSRDNWTTLPPLPVQCFGLGQINGKLVAVGGTKSDWSKSKEVYTYEERPKKWKQTIPPMPTARDSPGTLSLQSALLVAGGEIVGDYGLKDTDTVEVFKVDTSQWHKTDPLPIPCSDFSLTVIGNTMSCYAMGGFGKSYTHLNQTHYASVDDLLQNVVPAHQSSSDDTPSSAWKRIADTPTYDPTAAVLAGRILAMGGIERSEGGSDMKEVYMYSPSAFSWIYISDLPAPRYRAAAAVLSSTEILVIGGLCGDRVRTVYKGTLQLKL